MRVGVYEYQGSAGRAICVLNINQTRWEVVEVALYSFSTVRRKMGFCYGQSSNGLCNVLEWTQNGTQRGRNIVLIREPLVWW